MAEKRKLDASQVVDAPSYRKGAPEKVKAEFKASKSAFGGTSASFTNVDGSSITVTTPWCDLAFEVEPWDDVKQARFGKEKDKKLDPKRKSDKWNVSLKVEEDLFIEYLNKLQSAVSVAVYDQRDSVWRDGSKKNLKSAEHLDGSWEPFYKIDEKNPIPIFKCDARSEVGAKEIGVPVIEWKSGDEVPLAALGRGTQVAAVVDFSSGYINKTIKVYATPIKLYVRNIVAPKIRDPDAFRPELDD